MRHPSRVFVFSITLVAAVALAVPASAAVRYDLSNPSSTGCVSKGPVQYTKTVRTYGVWSLRLRSSTGCSTVWAYLTRTDTLRCKDGGANCGQVRLTRTLGNGTKTATAWRKTPGGTKAVLSLQLNLLSNAKYVATATTTAGAAIGASGTISVDAKGVITSS